MNSIIKLAGLALACLVTLAGCRKDEETPAPAITGVMPPQGSAGTTVVISGKNFSSAVGDNVVLFNGTQAPVTDASAFQLTTAVPAGATTGKITVTVNDHTATSPTDFIVIEPPSILSFSPLYGVPGTPVLITGRNFDSRPTANTVLFNGMPAAVTAATATQLTVVIPAGAVTGRISVSVNNLTVVSANDFEVLGDIPRTGLVAFYPFTGSADDASGNGLHGTPMHGAALANDRFGKSGQAFQFNTGNDHINLGNPDRLRISETITVAAWLNLHVLKTNTAMYILTKLGFVTGNPNRGYSVSLKFADTGNPAFSLRSLSTSDDRSFTAGSAATGQWIFCALIIDGTRWKFYQNNDLLEDETAGSVILDDGTQGDLVIGNFNGGGFEFDGLIDDVAVYDRALTPAEVDQLYSQTVSKY